VSARSPLAADRAKREKAVNARDVGADVVTAPSGVPAVFDKVVALEDAFRGLDSGATVLVGGFGEVGLPSLLVETLGDLGLRELTVVANNAGVELRGIARLLSTGAVRRIICSYPRSAGSHVFEELYRAGRVELELVPQGTLAERLRAGGSGLGPFYCPVGVGTSLAAGRETRTIDGQTYVLERPIRGELALVHAHVADRYGNLRYRATARNLNPIMAMAARTTVAEVDILLPSGSYLDPDQVHTPNIFVNRIVALDDGGSA